uniref:Uncharacterized protein n=1 Tax=Triticum urartu TaxID=4572 RepID=A0A8R7UAM4_TRIUA
MCKPITQVAENRDEDVVICWLSSLTKTGGASVSVDFKFWPFPFKCWSIIIQNKFLHYSIRSQNKVLKAPDCLQFHTTVN